MTPTFLGIGVPRGGTTWLHQLLMTHPDVAMATRRKEVHYFDLDYDRGQAWYEAFFPADGDRYQAVGEITPHYLFDEKCAPRIAKMASIKNLLVMLRNPVDRAYSHYLYRMRQDNYRHGFEQFLKDRPEAVQWSRYAQPLEHYFEHFPREQMLILIHEHAFQDVEATRRQVAETIGVDPDRFPDDAGAERVNTVVLPKHRRLASWASKIGASMRRNNMDWIPNLIGRKLGAKRLFGKSSAPKPMLDRGLRNRLLEGFVDDIESVEKLLRLDLSVWKPEESAGRADGGNVEPAAQNRPEATEGV